MRHQLFVLDSRDRNVGGDVNDFFLSLRPALQNVRRVRFLFADVPSPDGNVEPYYLLRTSLGENVRGASHGADSSFIIPVTSAAGLRSYHESGSSFHEETYESPGRTLSELAVSVRVRGGGSANLTGDWYAVLEISCD
jgi:hypothetical protein